MYELKDGFDAEDSKELKEKDAKQELDFQSRLQNEEFDKNADRIRTSSTGNMSITFNPSSKKRRGDTGVSAGTDTRERRSAGSSRGTDTAGRGRGRGRGGARRKGGNSRGR